MGVVNCHLTERFVLALQRGVRFGSPFIQCWAWQQGCNVLWLPIIGVRCFTIALYTISDRTVRYGSSAAFYRWVQSVFPIFGKQVVTGVLWVRLLLSYLCTFGYGCRAALKRGGVAVYLIEACSLPSVLKRRTFGYGALFQIWKKVNVVGLN